MLRKISVIVFMIFLSSKVNAGADICYVYKGSIGSKAVLFNIQIEALLPKAHLLNVNGVYIYQNENSPIPLTGSLDLTNKKLVLKEVIGGKTTAILSFTFSEMYLTGSRKGTNSNQLQVIHLRETANLTDTAAFNNVKVTGVEIMQDTSLKNYLLVGIYSKNSRYYGADMDQLKLIDKKSGKTFQIIDLSSLDDPSGVVIGNIFRNVEIKDQNKDGYDDIVIWNNAAKFGSRLYAYFNPALKRFKLDPNPEEIHIERHWPGN